MMRLQMLERGNGLLHRSQFGLLRRFLGLVPGPVAALSYRRNFFGKHFARCFQEAMCAGGEWRVGELEIFAAFVSSLNRCRF
jgi:hypothetical protein